MLASTYLFCYHRSKNVKRIFLFGIHFLEIHLQKKHEIHKSCFAKFIEPKYDMVQQHTGNLYYASHTGHIEIALFRYVEVRTNPHKEISCPICRTKIFDKKCPKSKS